MKTKIHKLLRLTSLLGTVLALGLLLVLNVQAILNSRSGTGSNITGWNTGSFFTALADEPPCPPGNIAYFLTHEDCIFAGGIFQGAIQDDLGWCCYDPDCWYTCISKVGYVCDLYGEFLMDHVFDCRP